MKKKQPPRYHVPTRAALITLMLQQQREVLPIDRIEPDMSGLGGCFAFILLIDGRARRALILVRSSDYWFRRVHLALQHQHADLDMLVVWEHDMCVPLTVLALNSGVLHSPLALPRPVAGRNRYTARVILGQLLCGVQSAYDELATMPRSTAYRYLSSVASLSKRRRGRPLKI